MLIFLTLLVMLIVGYAHVREGLFTALVMFVSVLFAGVVTFNFWEPTADALEQALRGTFLETFADFLSMMLIFALCLGLLRAVTNNIARAELDFVPIVNQVAAGLFGVLTGYLLAGFLTCAMETLPLHENFMSFNPRNATEAPMRRFLPPDRVWLALMRHAGAYGFANEEIDAGAESRYERYRTFDRHGTFELRYLRYRRSGDNRDPLPYRGEMEAELDKTK